MSYFSGMRPTGKLHLGHYFGTIVNWLELQKENEGFLMIADLHALTTVKSTKNIKQNSLEMVLDWLACGVDPQKNIIFVQSQIPYHTELSWIISCLLPVSMAELNPTYKEVLAENIKNNNLGLLSYPALQSADILLYKAESVPIGKDQLPHIEITRELARRFNNNFGQTFKEPKPILTKESKIYSLADPMLKMSKSHVEKNYIALFDEPDVILQKIKTAVTDSGSEIIFDPEKKAGISNLLTLMSLASGKNIKELEKEFAGVKYTEFKQAVGFAISEFLRPVREKRKELEENRDAVLKILQSGRERALVIAEKNMVEIKEKIGLFL